MVSSGQHAERREKPTHSLCGRRDYTYVGLRQDISSVGELGGRHRSPSVGSFGRATPGNQQGGHERIEWNNFGGWTNCRIRSYIRVGAVRPPRSHLWSCPLCKVVLGKLEGWEPPFLQETPEETMKCGEPGAYFIYENGATEPRHNAKQWPCGTELPTAGRNRLIVACR